MKRIGCSNKREEVIVKRRNSLSLRVSFCFSLIITIPFLIITKFSFINSIILSGVFLSSVYIFLFLLISILLSLKKHLSVVLCGGRGGGRFKIHPLGRSPEKFCGPYGRANLPLYKDRWVNLYKGRSLKTKKCI